MSRKKERQFEFSDFEDNDVQKQLSLLEGYDKLCLMSFIVLGVIENKDGLIIPEWLNIPVALDIVMRSPKTSRIVYNRALRDYNEPEHITKNENEVEFEGIVKSDSIVNLIDKVKQKRGELNDIRSTKR